MFNTPQTTVKRKSQSPLENTNKKVQTIDKTPLPVKMSDQKFDVNTAKAMMYEAKSKQTYALQTSSHLQPNEKKQAELILDVVAPLFSCMLDAFDRMLKTQSTDTMHSIAEQHVNQNNARLQNCLVESVYETDKLECRQRYKNLRITGLNINPDEPPKTAVIRFASAHGIEIKSEQIDEAIELKGKYASKYQSHLVRFNSERDRDQFIEAKFAAINRKKELHAEISNLRQSGTDTDLALAETKKRNELEPLAQVRIQEDLTPRRLSLLRVVNSSEMVKYFFTRNGVIHAVTNFRLFCELFEISVDEVHLLLADTRRISDPRCAKK